MNTVDNVAVCSRSFSTNRILRNELLDRYKNVKFNDAGVSLAGDGLVQFLKGHNKAITALERIDEYILSKVPELKVIGKVGVGLDMLDLDALRRHGVALGWSGGVNRRSVAELTLALIICSLRHVCTVNRDILRGVWKQRVGSELTGKTVGIAGLGHIGRELVLLLKPFNCRLLAYDISAQGEFCHEHNIEQRDLDTLLADSDIVSLHLPLAEKTKAIINQGRLGLMKPSAILINTARGGLVDESALKITLQQNRLRAAAFDVFADEPPRDQELVSLPNFLATAHISGSTEEAVLAMGRAAIAGLESSTLLSERV